jgi:hypothetical protein
MAKLIGAFLQYHCDCAEKGRRNLKDTGDKIENTLLCLRTLLIGFDKFYKAVTSYANGRRRFWDMS